MKKMLFICSKNPIQKTPGNWMHCRDCGESVWFSLSSAERAAQFPGYELCVKCDVCGIDKPAAAAGFSVGK